MPYGSPWPMTISSIGSVSCATVAFRAQGKLRVTAIVKATFGLEDGQPMERIDPEPVVMHDKHFEGNPARSLQRACETAPYQPRADVLLTGYAVAPMKKRSVSTFAVRMVVQHESTQLVDKRLGVRGDLDRATKQASAFERLPLVYELAAGGPDVDENPVGVTPRPDVHPNIYDPRGPGPAGYGPLSRRWPIRRKLLGTLDPKRFDALVTDVPAGFPWEYFQAAPADQRVPFLRGDEWIALEGTHPSFARLTSQLPSVRGVARLYGPTPELGAGTWIPLVLDMLIIDAGSCVCSAVWRGSYPIASMGDFATFRIYGAVQQGEFPIPWPPSYEDPRPQSARPSTGSGPGPHMTTTSDMSAADQSALRKAPATPFLASRGGGPSPAVPRPSPLEVTEVSAGDDDRHDPLRARTEDIPQSREARAARSPATPFEARPARSPATPFEARGLRPPNTPVPAASASKASRPSAPRVDVASARLHGAQTVVFPVDAGPPAPATPFERPPPITPARPAPIPPPTVSLSDDLDTLPPNTAPAGRLPLPVEPAWLAARPGEAAAEEPPSSREEPPTLPRPDIAAAAPSAASPGAAEGPLGPSFLEAMARARERHQR
jgi:hypothetical protein